MSNCDVVVKALNISWGYCGTFVVEKVPYKSIIVLTFPFLDVTETNVTKNEGMHISGLSDRSANTEETKFNGLFH